MTVKQQKLILTVAWIIVIGLGLHLRVAGVFRGLGGDYIYHPDEPKQVNALHQFMQGRYVWYTENHFYDGYPFGLNHLDELILRPTLFAAGVVGRAIDPGLAREAVPRRGDLYYYARALRVLYGMLCLFMAFLIAHVFLESKWERLGAVFVLSLIPLSSTVTHTATGDIGVDLFCGIMLLFLCWYAVTGKWKWMFWASVATGLAFACKYNGLLCGAAIGIFLLCRRDIWSSVKRLSLYVGSVVVGVLSGAILGTPACLINWKQTWQDVFVNFRFIQKYGVSDAFLSKPLLERWISTVPRNSTRVVGDLGVVVVFLALAGVALAVVTMLREARRKKSSAGAVPAVRVAILSFPFVALLISVFGKPELQPFHFSYLAMPLALGASYCVACGIRAKSWAIKCAVGILALLAIVELGVKVEKEHFFWKTEDNSYLATHFVRTVFSGDDPRIGRQSVRTIFVETESPAVFRNRIRHIDIKNAELWNRLEIAPVPVVAYPLDHQWIFLNGPVFPRTDRMFLVNGGDSRSKYLVLHGAEDKVVVGVRSGSLPSLVSISLGKDLKKIVLAPNSQELVVLTPKRWRTIDGSPERRPDGRIVHFKVSASVGDVVVQALAKDAEIDHFKLFGGVAETLSRDILAGLDKKMVVNELEQTRFLESDETHSIDLKTSDVKNPSSCIIPRVEGPHPDALLLPCGAYELEVDVTGLVEDTRVSLHIDDMLGVDSLVQAKQVFDVKKDAQTLRYVFEKSFAPYQSRIVVTCLQGECTVGKWRLKPSVSKVVDDLVLWQEGGGRPSWLTRYPSSPVDIVDATGKGITFDGRIDLQHYRFPEVITPGERLSVQCGLVLASFPFRCLADYFVFFHLIDDSGEQVYADGVSVSSAIANQEPGYEMPCKIVPNLEPGQYRVEMGIWHPRTRKILPAAADAGILSEDGEKVCIGTTRVEE
jgi:hypothetical protein